jgi:multidrug efflux pump subunit AcrB
VHLAPFYDQSELVHESIASVRDAILIGLLLACLILFLFLRDWTSSLIAGLVIPVTVAITILFLWAIGESFNLMTLGGLAAAIGLVIDDAIVVVENIVVHRDSGQTRVEAVRSALREIMVPLVGSTITPVVVFVPLVAVTGVTGTFFRALALTMTASLLTSLLLALTSSRRTGLQMGLAAVTEANTGDFTVKLKAKRSRGVEDVMEDVRNEIKSKEPELDIELTQVLQDNINDLSNAPEPIQIKIYSDDAQLLTQLGPRVGDAIGKIPGVVDVEDGVENTVSGPATDFQIDPGVAARLGFTATEIAEDATSILDGLPTNQPLIANGRPYTIRVRLGDETRKSLDTIQATVFNSASGHTASLGSLATVTQLPPQDEILRENLQRLIVVTGNLEGSDLGTAMTKVRATVAGLHLPASARVEYGGTYEEQQKSFRDLLQVLLLALALVFGVLLAEFRNFPAPIAILTSSVLSISGVIAALLITRVSFNVASFMGLIMVIGIVAKNGILLLDAEERFRAEGASARDAMFHAAQRRLRPIAMTAIAAVCGMLPLAFALGAGSQMLQPLAIAVIGGLAVSMVLSLVVTPLVYYLLTRNREAEANDAAA